MNSHVYGGHIESRVATYLRDHMAATRVFVGCTGTPTPPTIPPGYAQVLNLFLWDLRYPILFGCTISSWYLAVHSGSSLDTPWSLSRASTRLMLNMVHQTPSVSK